MTRIARIRKAIRDFTGRTDRDDFAALGLVLAGR